MNRICLSNKSYVPTTIVAVWPQVHDRDALPQPQFVAPVLEAPKAAETVATGSLKRPKSPGKAPPPKAKAPAVVAVKKQPAAQSDSTDATAAEPATE